MVLSLDKKGVSQVVTTVLIILLSLAAVVIIWSFVNPLISQIGDGTGSDCFTLNLEVVNCVGNVGPPLGTDLRIKRNAGQGALTGMRFVLTDSSGTTIVNDTNIALGELASQMFNVSGFNAVSVEVAALVGENKKSCNPTQAPVNCT